MLAGFDQLFGFAEGWGSYENDYLFFWYRVKEVGHLSNFSAADASEPLTMPPEHKPI